MELDPRVMIMINKVLRDPETQAEILMKFLENLSDKSKMLHVYNVLKIAYKKNPRKMRPKYILLIEMLAKIMGYEVQLVYEKTDKASNNKR